MAGTYESDIHTPFVISSKTRPLLAQSSEIHSLTQLLSKYSL